MEPPPLPRPDSAPAAEARVPRRLGPGDVAIIVLNWNGRDCTLECLDSLVRAGLGGASLLLVDNGSSDGSVAAVQARFPDVRVLALPENRGYAGGNNAGIEVALRNGAGAVLLLNNDTQVAPDFLGPLLQVLNDEPRAAAVSSAIMRLDSPELLQEAYFEIYFGFGIIRRRGVNALPGEGYDEVRYVDAAIGCSLLIRAEALASVGHLDESYFAYHEEVDWCVRARQAGWYIVYQPYSRVWHHFSKSTETPRPVSSRKWNRASPGELPNPYPVPWNPVRAYLGARNSVRFIRRHASRRNKLYFALSTAYALPLEFLAVVLEREEELWLGLLTYRWALASYLLEESGAPAEAVRSGRATRGQRARAVVRAPLTLLWSLRRDILRARRDGRMVQVCASLKGLWDGLLNRPLPLERLGLRGGA